MQVTIEYSCGHTEEKWNPIRKADLPGYLDRAKARPCKECKVRRASISLHRITRYQERRERLSLLRTVAACLRVARPGGLKPAEARYVRRYMSYLDRQDTATFGSPSHPASDIVEICFPPCFSEDTV